MISESTFLDKKKLLKKNSLHKIFWGKIFKKIFFFNKYPPKSETKITNNVLRF